MEKLSEDQFQSINEIVTKLGPQGPVFINGFFKTARPSQKLLKHDNVKSVRISRDEREFSTEDPCFIRSIDVYGSEPNTIEKILLIVVVKPDGARIKIEPQKLNVSTADGTVVTIVRYLVKGMCSSVVVKADAYIRTLAISKIRITGYSLSQMDEAAKSVSLVLEKVAKFDAYVSAKKKEVEDAEENKTSIEARSAELEVAVEETEEKLSELSAALAALEESNASKTYEKASLEKQASEFQAKLVAFQNNETQLKASVDALNKEIVAKQNELKSIVNDRSLISDEYKDYVSEGQRQSKVYEWFLYFSIAVLALCSWQLFTGAQRILLAEIDTQKALLTMVLQRAPFAAAIALVVGVAWKLAAMFVSRIMTIHAQRLALARLLVIAKDTVYSSTTGLDISDEEKFKERIKLKLQMLRSHLTSELGKDFEYNADHNEKKLTASNEDSSIVKETSPSDSARSG